MNLNSNLHDTRIPTPTRVAFCQISDMLIKPEDHKYRQFYGKCYDNMLGFHFRDDFLDVPHWIPIISGRIDRSIEQNLIVIRDIESGVENLKSGQFDYIFFSVMNVNVHFIKSIVSECENMDFILGGYVSADEFDSFENCTFLDAPEQLSLFPSLNYQDDLGPRYHLLKDGKDHIPRITLSTGCKHKCSFCSVPRLVRAISDQQIESQLDALSDIRHSLIYLDDKTFGQCENHRYLDDLFLKIIKFNKDFQGFIVQSTATQLLANEGALLTDSISNLHVRYFEVGVETCRDDLLKTLKKPHRMKHVRQVCEFIRRHNRTSEVRTNGGEVYLIPNLIFGIPGDDYAGTFDFIEEYIDIIPTFNYANLSVYPDRRGGNITNIFPGDEDDYSFQKSWLNKQQIDAGRKTLSDLMAIFHEKYSTNVHQSQIDDTGQASLSTTRRHAENSRVACDSPSGSRSWLSSDLSR